MIIYNSFHLTLTVFMYIFLIQTSKTVLLSKVQAKDPLYGHVTSDDLEGMAIKKSRERASEGRENAREREREREREGGREGD